MDGKLPSYACGIVMVISAACGAPSGSLTGPMDPQGAPDAGVDAGPVDTGVDAGPIDAGTPPDLAAICGAVPVTFDDWEDCYKKRRCDFEVGCIPENAYRDVQECLDSGDAVEGGRLSAERRVRKRAVTEGRASINVDAFTRCLTETSGAHCNTTQFYVPCAIRFLGTIGDGAACDADVECASPGAECVSSCSDACCTGTCQPKVKEGLPCSSSSPCEPGLQCHRVCIAGDINTPCASDRDCDPNAWCDVQARLCKADFAPGAACTNPLQCGGQTSCVGLSVSSTNPGHCLRISRVGDTCDAFCYGNLFCDGAFCRALPGPGQACPLVSCAGVDTVCSNDVCVARSAAGVSCGAQTCLPGLFCTSKLNDPSPTCAARRTEGEPCADPSHCESYLCSGNSVQPGVCLAWSDTCSLAGN
jgi:hypothetical protein